MITARPGELVLIALMSSSTFLPGRLAVRIAAPPGVGMPVVDVDLTHPNELVAREGIPLVRLGVEALEAVPLVPEVARVHGVRKSPEA